MSRWVAVCPQCGEELDVLASVMVTTPIGRPLTTNDHDARERHFHCCYEHDCGSSFDCECEDVLCGCTYEYVGPDGGHCECHTETPEVTCRNACRKPSVAFSRVACQRNIGTRLVPGAKGQP